MTLEEMYLSVCAYDGHCQYTSDKGSEHYYIKGYYGHEFHDKRDTVKNILEIGVASGGSLVLWTQWFTNAKVLGIDISEDSIEGYKKTCGEKEYPNVEIRIQDAYSDPVIAEHPDDFYDYIIDDGPHSIQSMVVAVRNWLPKIKPGGKLIIEDIQNYDWFIALEKEIDKELSQESQRFDFRKSKNRYDDMIFEVTRSK